MIGLRGVPAEYSGVEKAVEEIGHRIAAQGHFVTVYCMAGRYPHRRSEYRGMHLRYLPTIRSKNLEMITYAFLATADSLLEPFDIIHFHAVGPSSMSFLTRIFNRKTVATVHALDYRNRKWSKFARGYLKCGEWCATHFAHKTIAVSNTLKIDLEKRHSCDVTYIPNGTDVVTAQPSRSSILQKFGLEVKKFILFVGRITKEKNIHLLIRAFKRIDADIRLVIVGGTTDIPLEFLEREAQGDSRIVFTGPIYGNHLATLYSNAYLFVLPSILEGLPVVLLEAMSHKVPVLVSDIPANIEVISSGNGEVGFSFASGNEGDLTRVLRSLLNDANRLQDAAERAHLLIKQRYHWDTIAEETLELYQQLVT
jgi:glycosyltransferase involved in cell wall biosynthesis